MNKSRRTTLRGSQESNEMAVLQGDGACGVFFSYSHKDDRYRQRIDGIAKKIARDEESRGESGENGYPVLEQQVGQWMMDRPRER